MVTFLQISSPYPTHRLKQKDTQQKELWSQYIKIINHKGSIDNII